MQMTETDIPDQRDLVPDTIDRWYILLDGCRYDSFERLYDRHVEGTLQRTYTGASWTPDYFNRVWGGTYDGIFFHGGAPLHMAKMNDVYDEREHFTTVPAPNAYEWASALGTSRPRQVADVVRDYTTPMQRDEWYQMETPQCGVIRFLQPHEPLLGLPITKGRGKISRVQNAIEAGDLSPSHIRGAYEATLDWALDAVGDLVEDLPGEVVITADHGTCFGDCGQFAHARGHDNHDHLIETPWLVVDG